jgi:lycopene cyclase domain-containing protein
MSRIAYLAYLIVMSGGMLVGGGRLRILDARLLRSIIVTVPIFLVFDLVGVARGWFYTDPALNLWILPGGVSIEEVINLMFLTALSVVLAQGWRRWRHA